MSVQGVAAVLDHSRSELATRLVAISLGNHADKYGITWPSSRLAAIEAGIARETARKSIMKLRDELGELAMLVEADNTTHRPPLYWLRLPGLSGEFAEDGGADRYFKAFGEGLRNEAEARCLLLEGEGGEDLTVGVPTNRRGAHIEEPSKEPSEKKHRVNKKIVTEDELALTAAVVSQFNSSAGTALSAEAHLTPIVGRIRERPHYTEDHHRRIIEAVFAGDHWWTGPPTPKIIYGNASIFEQSIELARARKKKAQGFDVNDEAKRIRKEQGLEEDED